MADSLIVQANGGSSFEDGPDHGRVLIAGEATGNAYSLMELTVAPHAADVGFGPHLHHDIHEVFVVRRGTLEFLLRSDVTTLIAGDVVRVPPGVRHGYRNVSDEPVDLLVWFTPGGFEHLFVKYRTDQPNLDEHGFLNEATSRFNSRFEDNDTADDRAADQPGARHHEDLLVERRHLLPLLETLTADQWNVSTLCEGWRVREVVAHLTYSWSNTLLGLPTWLRHRKDIDRAFALFAQQRAQTDDRVLLQRYRRAVESGYKPPRVPPEILWCDNVIHGLDIRRPLGLHYPGDKHNLTRAAECLTMMTWPSRTACRSEGLRFIATDVEWSVGAGPHVTGPIEDILIAIAGRRLIDSELTGDGVDVLAQRP
jgi:uncharacterized protein (TIGR03083 family)